LSDATETTEATEQPPVDLADKSAVCGIPYRMFQQFYAVLPKDFRRLWRPIAVNLKAYDREVKRRLRHGEGAGADEERLKRLRARLEEIERGQQPDDVKRKAKVMAILDAVDPETLVQGLSVGAAKGDAAMIKLFAQLAGALEEEKVDRIPPVFNLNVICAPVPSPDDRNALERPAPLMITDGN
jgi:hypothetical protein